MLGESAYLFLPHNAACWISVPLPGTEPGPQQQKPRILGDQGTPKKVFFKVRIPYKLKSQNKWKVKITAFLLLYWLRQTLWLCGKFFKRWEYQTIWPASWEICMQVKKQQRELDMEQQTGSK